MILVVLHIFILTCIIRICIVRVVNHIFDSMKMCTQLLLSLFYVISAVIITSVSA